MKKDIETLEDIKLIVNTFYQRIQKNEVLGPIFEERIADRWEQHLEKMYRFWQTILFNELHIAAHLFLLMPLCP